MTLESPMANSMNSKNNGVKPLSLAPASKVQPSNGRPPLKRKRLEGDVGYAEPQNVSTGHDMQVDIDGVNDVEYFFEDGDVVLSVERILFKVHGFILKRDNSKFSALLSESRSTLQNPLHLQDEKADDMRRLIWVLYALPDELGLQSGNMTLLATVATMARKYSFTKITLWAGEALHKVVRPPRGALASASAQVLSRMLQLSEDLQHQGVQDTIVQHCCARLLSEADGGSLARVLTLDVVERVNDSRLGGAAYYAHVKQIDASDLGERPSGPTGSPRTMLLKTETKKQAIRLALGHWALVQQSERRRSSPPIFLCPEGCKDRDAHSKLWCGKWEQYTATRVKPPADLLGMLERISDNMYTDEELKRNLSGSCRQSALASLGQLIEKTSDNLWRHFVDFTDDE